MAAKYVIKETKTGFVFNLKATNGEVIATSEVYSALAGCKNGIKSVQKNAPIAAIEDQTEKDFEKLLPWNIKITEFHEEGTWKNNM